MTATPQRSARRATVSEATAPLRRFRVMRRFPLSGREMAEVGTILEEGPDWPFRRAKQFVDLGYLAPIVTEEG